MSYGVKVERENFTIIIMVSSEDEIDAQNDWVDATVTLNTGERYFPSFFTTKKIQAIMLSDKRTDENLRGLYFWSADLIILETISVATITNTIQHLYDTDKLAFVLCHTCDDGESD